MNIALWIIQCLVALGFLLAGVMKSFSPIDTLKKNMDWTGRVPAGFVRFIGVAELLGAIGLILPAATGILPWLTIAAAVGLALVMIFATIYHASRREYTSIGMNVILLLLAVFIVLGRVTLAPL